MWLLPMPVVAPSWSLGAVPGAVWSHRRLMAPVPAALLLLSSFLPALAAEQGRPEYPEFQGGVYVSGQLHSGAAEWLGHLSRVLQVIQPAQYPDELQETIEKLSWEHGPALESLVRLAKQLVSADPGLSALVLTCTSLAALVPLVLCAVCCRRLACPPAETAGDVRWRECRTTGAAAALLLTLCLVFCLAVLLLAAAVLIRGGLGQSRPALAAALTDTRTAVNNTEALLKKLTSVDVARASQQALRVLTDWPRQSADRISLRLASESGVTQLFDALFKLDSNLQAVTAGVLALDTSLTNLTASWPALVERLSDLSRQLERALAQCSPADAELCAALQPGDILLPPLTVDQRHLQPSLLLIRRYRSADLPALVEQVQTAVNALASSLQQSITRLRPGISRELQMSADRAKKYLTETLPSITRTAAHLQSTSDSSLQQPAVADMFRTAVWALTLGVPALVLLLTSLLYGAVVGSYFPRRSASRPHRHTVNTLRLSVGLMAAVSALLWLAVAVGALVAGLMQTTTCGAGRQLQRPADVSRVIWGLGRRAPLRPGAAGSVTDALTQTLSVCRNGGGVLSALKLGRPEDVVAATRLDTPRMHSLLREVTGKPSKAALLADRLSQYLGMTRALVGTDLGEIKQQLEVPAASASVPAQLSQLTSALGQLQSPADLTRLRPLAERLTRLVTGPVYALQKQKARLVVEVATLDMTLLALRGPESSMHQRVAAVDRFLASNASHIVRQEASVFSQALTSQLLNFSDHVSGSLKRHLHCGHLWNAFRSAAAVTCTRLLSGINGYWVSSLLIGLLLLLLLPVTVELMDLLQRQECAPLQRTPSSEETKLWTSSSVERDQTKACPTPPGAEAGDGNRW